MFTQDLTLAPILVTTQEVTYEDKKRLVLLGPGIKKRVDSVRDTPFEELERQINTTFTELQRALGVHMDGYAWYAEALNTISLINNSIFATAYPMSFSYKAPLSEIRPVDSLPSPSGHSVSWHEHPEVAPTISKGILHKRHASNLMTASHLHGLPKSFDFTNLSRSINEDI